MSRKIERLKKYYFGNLPRPERFDTVEKQFGWLVCALEPENLSCDGELSSSEVQRKYRDFMDLWQGLENELGRTVTEEEAWGWI